MHELSIALGILDLAAEEAERRGGVRISAIHLRLGALSGVLKEALSSAYDLASQETALEGCRLVIEEVPVTVLCPVCSVERRIGSVQEMACPACGTPASDVLTGRELEVFAMEIEV